MNHQKNKNTRKEQTIITLFGCLMVVLTQAGITLYLPSWPAIQQTFHTTHSLLALTLTAYMLGYALPMLLWGPLSDHIGRRYGLLIALALFTLTSVLLAITKVITHFILLRFLQGAGGGGVAIIGRAAIRDSFEQALLVRAMSYVSISFIIALGVCQVLGGYIEHHSAWQHEFWLMGVIGILAFLLVALFFPEITHKISFLPGQKKARTILQNYFAIMGNKNFIYLAIGGGIGYGITIAFHVISPFLLQVKLHLSSVQYGYLGLVISAAYLLGTFFTNRCVVSLGINKLIQAGLFTILAFGLILLAFALLGVFNVYVIMMPLFFITIGQALIYPCAMALALKAYKERAGYATGLFSFIQQSLASMTAAIAAFLPHNTQASLALIIMTIGLLAFLCFFKEIRYGTSLARL